MSDSEIVSRLRNISDSAGDNEAAHYAEDKLYKDFIRYVATLEIPLRHKAMQVLSAEKIKFDRWYA